MSEGMSRPHSTGLVLLTLLLFLASQDYGLARAQQDQPQCAMDNSSGMTFAFDPVLLHQPPFARSLPVQILLTGIVFTLTTVLLLHLAFTAQYHFPLAPVNYSLQLSGVTLLLISLIATIKVVLDTAFSDSQTWPYMLTYIAIDVPPDGVNDDDATWTRAELAAWYVMEAITSAVIHITHIQFLTLLFPSRLEARLIFSLLGPLAIVSASMVLLPLASASQQLADLAAVIRNTCNAAMSLLFSLSLLLFSVLHRPYTFNPSGGTLAFGAAALTLTFVSSGLNFWYIKTQYVWMPGLMWAVILWQSFLGWWWWVGAGMGRGGEELSVEEIVRRGEEARTIRKKGSGSKTRRSRFRRTKKEVLSSEQEENSAVTTALDTTHALTPVLTNVSRATTDTTQSNATSESETTPSATAAPSSSPSTTQKGGLLRSWTTGWLKTLYRAHWSAARAQAAEQAQIRERVYADEAGTISNGTNETSSLDGERDADVDAVDETPRPRERRKKSGGHGYSVFGWGLGSFGIRERERRARRVRREKERAERRERGGGEGLGSGDDGAEWESDEDLEKEKAESEAAVGKGWWWWGPFRKWRLQDTTIY